MFIYFYILTIFFLLAFVEVLLKYDYKRLWLIDRLYWVAIVFLVLIAGLRTDSPDISAYYRMHFAIQNMNSFNEWRVKLLEPGFRLLFTLLKSVDFQFSLLASAFIGVVLKGIFLKRYTPYLFLSLAIYFTTTFMVKEMGQIRHGVAMGIALFAYDALFKKKNFKFVFFVLLATMFHYSALCMLPLFFFYKKEWPTYFYVILMIIGLPLCFINLQSYIFPLLGSVGISAIETKVILYSSQDQYTGSLGLNSTLVLLYMTFGLLLLFRGRLKDKYSYFNIFINIYALGVFYYLIFNSISEFGQRTTIYFRMLDILAFPLIISVLAFERWMLTILLCLNSYFTLYKRFTDPSMKPLFPYKNIYNDPLRSYKIMYKYK